MLTMHPRDLATMLDVIEEDEYQAGEPERQRKRRELHGLG